MKIKNSNNKGAVLIVLIVAFLIVTLLAASALKYSYIGLQISKSYNNLSKREYNAEEPLNIIRAGVQNDCSEILETEYDRMLDTYAYTPSSERNATFSEYYKKALDKKFNSYEKPIRELFLEYLEAADYDIDITDSPNKNGIYLYDNINVDFIEGNEEETEDGYRRTFGKYVISNIRINYSNSKGESATSGADIIIDIPIIFSEKKGGSFYKSGFKDYALIANDTLSYDVSATTNVRGNVYAGTGGIQVGKTSSPTFNINANYVNTRGNILVSNGSTLNISNKSSDTQCEILADNIVLESLFPDSTLNTFMNLSGIMYVADDLEVNIPNANVRLSGEYIGYGLETSDMSNGNIVSTNKNRSSSIILNKTGSLLDLKDLHRVVIAGDAYITPSKSEDLATTESILTTESLTTRFMQIAYMIPSSCLSTHTNPSQYFDGETVTIDYSLSLKNGGLDLSNAKYNILDEPIIITVPGRNGTTLQYYFLRFGSKYGEQQYIRDYMTFYEDYMNEKANKLFGQPSVIIDDNNSYAMDGNFISYDYNDEGNLELKIMHSITYDDDRFVADATTAINKANSINSTLKYNETTTLTDDLFDTIINKDNIDDSYTYAYYTLDDYEIVDMPSTVKNNVAKAKDLGSLIYDCIVYTGTVPYTIPSNMRNGLVIAYGDVIVTHDFMGCIISNGNICIQSSCNIANDNEDSGEYPLMYLLDNNGYSDSATIQSFFKHYAIGGESVQDISELDVRNIVRFDNWVEY